MITSEQYVVSDTNLSHVWARVFVEAWSRCEADIAPLVATITGLEAVDEPQEDADIRQALDHSLRSLGSRLSCGTVASTIFPESMWNPCRPRRELYDRFDRIWPKVKKCPGNRRGHYFRRLTQFGDGRHANQLEYIIETYRGGNHRRSALQAALLDPARDHTHSRQQGFPCLQQIAFTPLGDDKLGVTGFYGLQYVFERAYGNYLGLYRLGRFMAQEMGLKLVKATCVASAAKLKDTRIRKGDLDPLLEVVRKVLPEDVTGAAARDTGNVARV